MRKKFLSGLFCCLLSIISSVAEAGEEVEISLADVPVKVVVCNPLFLQAENDQLKKQTSSGLEWMNHESILAQLEGHIQMNSCFTSMTSFPRPYTQWVSQEFEGKEFHIGDKAKDLLWMYLGRDRVTNEIKYWASLSFCQPCPAMGSDQWVRSVENEDATGGIHMQGPLSEKIEDNSSVWLHINGGWFPTYSPPSEMSPPEEPQAGFRRFIQSLFKGLEARLQTKGPSPLWIYVKGNESHQETFRPVAKLKGLWMQPKAAMPGEEQAWREAGFKDVLLRAQDTAAIQANAIQGMPHWRFEHVLAWKPQGS